MRRASLQPYEGSSETSSIGSAPSTCRALQPYEGSSETVGELVTLRGTVALQPYEGSSETWYKIGEIVIPDGASTLRGFV